MGPGVQVSDCLSFSSLMLGSELLWGATFLGLRKLDPETLSSFPAAKPTLHLNIKLRHRYLKPYLLPISILEASKGGMKVGRIKDPLYKDSYFGTTPPTFIPPFEAPDH